MSSRDWLAPMACPRSRYYAGRDYYNIWFDRTVHRLPCVLAQLGIESWSPTTC